MTSPASGADSAGFSRGFLVSAGIALLALLAAIAVIRVRPQDLAGAAPEPQGPTASLAPEPPAPVQRPQDQAALAAAARPCRFC